MNKEEKNDSSSNTKPVDKRVNNGVQKTISLYLRWDTGPADKEDPASEPEQDLVLPVPSEQAARKASL